MKNIAVLVHSLTSEYVIDILSGISDFCRNKDIRLFVYQTRNPVHGEDGFFHSDWAGVGLINSNQMDAVIVISASYLALIKGQFLPERLRDFKNMPVISIAMDYHAPNGYFTRIECNSTYYDVIKHLKEKHGCRKIAFMSGRLTPSVEAKERFDAFLRGLEKNNLEYDENLVFDGKLTKSSALAAISPVLKSKKDLKFDAILCANDNMALGVQEYLMSLDIKVPEDVCVIGFDETSYAANAFPKISTINQDVPAQGYKAAELAYNSINGKEQGREVVLSVEPVYRQSCGCIPLNNTENVYLNRKFEFCKKTDREMQILNKTGQHFNFLVEIDNIHTVFDMTNTVFTLRKIFYTIKYLMLNASMSAMAVCFFDEPVPLKFEKDFDLPDSMRVSMVIDNEDDVQLYEPGIVFNPHEYFLPENIFNNHSGNYIIYPIFSGDKSYGYLVCRLLRNEFDLYTIFLKIFTNTLAQAYEYTKTITENEHLSEKNQALQQDNSNLNQVSKTDELTRILNRRGFMEVAQRSIDIAVETHADGLVLFADMDNLKKINDTYGHEMGDKAIQAMAEVLAGSLRANDIVGRLSGDEFAVLAVGMKTEHLSGMRQKFQASIDRISREKNFPFDLSFSFGSVEFNAEVSDLKKLLVEADKGLYVEKKQKHANDKK